MGRITVFMPVYNAKKYLKEAVESILKQTYNDFEFLIIDDGSTDESRGILEQYDDERIRLVFNKGNKGIAYTRNLGLELCDTEFIAFMDADDIAPLDRLEKEIRYLNEHADIAGVGGYAQRIGERNEVLNKNYLMCLNPEYINAYMIFEDALANGSVMLRTNIIKENNIRYKPMEYAEDYCFFCEFLQYGLIANLNEIMQFYRVTDTGLSAMTKKKVRDDALDYVHEFNFNLYGFRFNYEQKQILFKVFREDGRTESEGELRLLYNALQEMIKQAKEKKLQNSKMIEIACRKQFGRHVAKAFWMWE